MVNPNEISPDMPVVCSNNGQFAVVDHLADDPDLSDAPAASRPLAGAAVMPFGWLLPIVAVFIAGGNGLIMPSLNALISRNSTGETQGVNMGLTQSAGALGRIVGPMIAGGMFEAVAPAAPMVSAAAMAGAVAIVAFLMIRELRPDSGR